MTEQRIMLLGAAGQVGQAIQHLSSHKALPSGWELHIFSRADVNVTDPAMLRTAIQTVKPQLVINASGMTNVDEAEKNEALATAVNFHAVAQMAAQCSMLDIPLIHLSTDFVFDGQKTSPYTTDDQMNPINTYGATKMMGEEALRHEHPFHVILRPSSIFGPFRRNILTTALSLIEEEQEMRIVTDLMSTPTSSIEIAKAVVTIGDELLRGKADGYGTFHFCGTPAASRYDFVAEVLKAYEPYTASRPKLVGTVCAEYGDHVRRPAYSVLDCSKIKTIYGVEAHPWRDSLAEAIEMLKRAGRLPKPRRASTW